MKKNNILKSNADFTRIINSQKCLKGYHFILYYEITESKNYHFGFSVGKKIGNAVTRNKIKRQLKNIIDKKEYQCGFNCVIITKRNVLDINYQEMSFELLKMLDKLKFIKREDLNV